MFVNFEKGYVPCWEVKLSDITSFNHFVNSDRKQLEWLLFGSLILYSFSIIKITVDQIRSRAWVPRDRLRNCGIIHTFWPTLLRWVLPGKENVLFPQLQFCQFQELMRSWAPCQNTCVDYFIVRAGTPLRYWYQYQYQCQYQDQCQYYCTLPTSFELWWIILNSCTQIWNLNTQKLACEMGLKLTSFLNDATPDLE